MKYKLFYENKNSTMGGYEYCGFLKLIWWIFLGRIKPTENSDIYYIKKIEYKNQRI